MVFKGGVLTFCKSYILYDADFCFCPKKVLLITPLGTGWCETISDASEELGYDNAWVVVRFQEEKNR